MMMSLFFNRKCQSFHENSLHQFKSDDDVGILFQYFHILTIFTRGLVVLRLRPQSFDVILSFILLDFYPPIHSILKKSISIHTLQNSSAILAELNSCLPPG